MTHPKKRRKRLNEIGRKVERYKKQPITQEQIIELLDDAIWILDQLEEMTQESINYLTKNNV